MNRVSQLLVKQIRVLLENRQHTLIFVVLFSVLPFTSWLALALVALVTLRKGVNRGGLALLVAMITHMLLLIALTTLDKALYSAILAFVPGFFAAYVLRVTSDWRCTFGILFLQGLVMALLVQLFAPELVSEQLVQVKLLMSEYQDLSAVLSLGRFKTIAGQAMLAHLLFSVQIAAVLVTNVLSLLFARSMQAKCFYPGEFKKEILAFRGGKMALIMLLAVSFAAYYQFYLAIDVLPLLLMYFLFSGFVLAYVVFTRKKFSGLTVLMFLSLLIKPIIMCPVYIVLGSLDSLFDFRVYFLAKTRKSV